MILTVGGSGVYKGGQIERICSLQWRSLDAHQTGVGRSSGFRTEVASPHLPQFVLPYGDYPERARFTSHRITSVTSHAASYLCYQMPGFLIVAVDGSRSVILVALVARPNLHPHPARASAPMRSDVLYLCVRPSDLNACQRIVPITWQFIKSAISTRVF